jgi:D-serine deaminase-like pyridoxal phosphate-dependent protein
VDGGSKTFSSDRWISGSREGFGYITEYPDVLFEGMSEEHGHLDVSKEPDRLRVGHRLSIIPNHVCACVNMHDRIWFHRNGLVEEHWQVEARGRIV